MKFKVILRAALLCTLLFPLWTETRAQAQTTPIMNRAQIPVGTVALYERENGNFYTITYFGREKQGFKDVVRKGRAGDGAVLATNYTNASGQLVFRKQRSSRRTYKPHNCVRTVGVCNFKYSSVGSNARVKRKTTLQADGSFKWEEKVYSNKAYNGVESYEPRFGLLKSRLWKDSHGKSRSTKLIEIRAR